jgi:hypothetical protein
MHHLVYHATLNIPGGKNHHAIWVDTDRSGTATGWLFQVAGDPSKAAMTFRERRKKWVLIGP